MSGVEKKSDTDCVFDSSKQNNHAMTNSLGHL